MATPNPQSYPVSKIKVGAVLYSCLAWTDDMGKTSTEINEWIVRSIQARRGTKSRMGCPTRFFSESTKYVNITQKIDLVTWGKRSSKTGDYGWLKTIPADFRKQFAVGHSLPRGIYTTIRAAVLCEVALTADSIARLAEKTVIEMDEELGELEDQHAALKRRLSKLDNLRTKVKQHDE